MAVRPNGCDTLFVPYNEGEFALVTGDNPTLPILLTGR